MRCDRHARSLDNAARSPRRQRAVLDAGLAHSPHCVSGVQAMTGVVAIASHKRDARVSDAEINDLTSAYESLRGVGTRQVARAGDFARVAEISLDVDVSNFSAPTAGSSWVIATGTPHDSGSSGGTDL